MALGGLVACSTLATAQDATNNVPKKSGKRGPSIERQLEQMTNQLNLTDDQKPKVKAALEDQQKKMQEMRGDTSLTREERQEKMQTIRADMEKKMKEILTPDQFEKWQKSRGQFQKKGPEGEKKQEEKKSE
jgi:Spy/CpxP family protein refolding chaperone